MNGTYANKGKKSPEVLLCTQPKEDAKMLKKQTRRTWLQSQGFSMPGHETLPGSTFDGITTDVEKRSPYPCSSVWTWGHFT
jgi:hypothetical protein